MALEKRGRINVRLLSLLKKTLAEREYRCLCLKSCEPCMVDTEEERRVQKHVFFTSNRLYLVDSGLKTEPKTLCKLEDILQVRKIDDLPCFLSKKDAEETAHVQVVYQSRVAEGKSPSSVLGKSPAFLRKLFGVHEKQIASSTDSLSSSGDLEELSGSQQSPLGDSPTLVPSRWKGERSRFEQASAQELLVSAVSPDSSDSKTGSLTESSATPHPSQSSTFSSTSEPHLFVNKSPSPYPSEPNMARRRKQKASSPLCHNNMTSLQAAISRDDPSVAMYDPSVAMHEPSVAMRGPSVAMHGPSVAMHGPSVAMHGDSSPSGSTHGNSRHQVALGHSSQLPTGRRSLNESSVSSWRSASSLPVDILHEDTNPRRSHSMDFDKAAGGDTPSLGSLQKAPRSLWSIDSLRSQASSITEGSPTCMRKITADFYILNRRSNFHQHLLLSCEEKLLSLTWHLGDTAVLPSQEMRPQEKLRTNYQKLQFEVLGSGECLEERAELLQELATACQKFEEIRQFFWEDSTMFNVCCRILQDHLPPAVAMATKGQRLIHRADQLELSILAMNVVYHMSRGGVYDVERQKLLASERGQLMLSLQSALMAPLTDNLEKRPLSASQKDEIQKLCWEATDASACLLSKLALVSQQQWREEGTHRLTPTWFAEALTLHSNSAGYFTRLMARCSLLLRSKELAPEEVITVYHIVHLLLFSCSNNADMLKRCRESFKEEIRYYLRLSVCQSIIGDHIPLKRRMLQLLKELKSLLLDQPSS